MIIGRTTPTVLRHQTLSLRLSSQMILTMKNLAENPVKFGVLVKPITMRPTAAHLLFLATRTVQNTKLTVLFTKFKHNKFTSLRLMMERGSDLFTPPI